MPGSGGSQLRFGGSIGGKYPVSYSAQICPGAALKQFAASWLCSIWRVMDSLGNGGPLSCSVLSGAEGAGEVELKHEGYRARL